jgi:hypothetical protein
LGPASGLGGLYWVREFVFGPNSVDITCPDKEFELDLDPYQKRPNPLPPPPQKKNDDQILILSFQKSCMFSHRSGGISCFLEILLYVEVFLFFLFFSNVNFCKSLVVLISQHACLISIIMAMRKSLILQTIIPHKESTDLIVLHKIFISLDCPFKL